MFYRLLLFPAVLLCCTTISDKDTISNPAGTNSSLPYLYTDHNTGKVFMSWVEEKSDTASLHYSVYDGNWSETAKISESDDWFVNWADYPSLISRKGEIMAAHWLDKIPGHTYSYNVNISTIEDNFSTAFVPHKDSTATEHGFVSMIPVSDSSLYAIWLDGRNMNHGHSGEFGDLTGAMTLRGAYIHLDGRVLEKHLIDESVCECCNTTLAKTQNGMIAAYRNRTEEEIRDIYVTRYENGKWTEPQAIFNDQWQIAACPVNGPSVDAFEESVGLVYFTSDDGQPVVKLSFSEDNGKSFSSPVTLDKDSPTGRVDIVMKDKASAWVSWITEKKNKTELRVELVSTSGQIINTYSVSEMNSSRSSGFPQITKYESGLLIAWTDLNKDKSKSVKTAIIQ